MLVFLTNETWTKFLLFIAARVSISQFEAIECFFQAAIHLCSLLRKLTEFIHHVYHFILIFTTL